MRPRSIVCILYCTVFNCPQFAPFHAQIEKKIEGDTRLLLYLSAAFLLALVLRGNQHSLAAVRKLLC